MTPVSPPSATKNQSIVTPAAPPSATQNESILTPVSSFAPEPPAAVAHAGEMVKLTIFGEVTTLQDFLGETKGALLFHDRS